MPIKEKLTKHRKALVIAGVTAATVGVGAAFVILESKLSFRTQLANHAMSVIEDLGGNPVELIAEKALATTIQ